MTGTALAKTEVVLFTSTAFHADVENVDTGHVANHRIITCTNMAADMGERW